MTKRSFFLTVAAGLLASVAFATPSQAASQTVTTTVSFTLAPGATGTVSDFTITYAPPIDSPPNPAPGVSGLAFTSTTGITAAPPGLTEASNTVSFTFNPVTSGAFVITFQTTSTSPTFTFTGFSFSGSATAVSSTVGVSPAVPEPTSMALLGIGMTGFLAFRRLFKRSSVALTS